MRRWDRRDQKVLGIIGLVFLPVFCLVICCMLAEVLIAIGVNPDMTDPSNVATSSSYYAVPDTSSAYDEPSGNPDLVQTLVCLAIWLLGPPLLGASLWWVLRRRGMVWSLAAFFSLMVAFIAFPA